MAKKRANGEGSIRKRKNDTWEGRYTIMDPETGKLTSKYVYGKSQREVKQKLKDMQEARIQEEAEKSSAASLSENVEENDLTLNEWLDIWLTDYLSDIKNGTLVSYKSLCNNHIRKELGKYKLKNLKPPVIQKFYNKLKGLGLSPKYIKNIHGCLHRALDTAVKVEYIEKNYSSVCSIPKAVQEEVNPLTEEEQKKLFAAMEGEFYEYMFITDIFTGLRCGELIVSALSRHGVKRCLNHKTLASFM